MKRKLDLFYTWFMLYEYPILIYDNVPLVMDSLCLDHLIAATLPAISYLFTVKGPFFLHGALKFTII